jgi:hypothetical protein
MVTYGWNGGITRAYLSSAVDGGERSASRPALPSLGEIFAGYNLYENGWAQESVWTLRRRQKSLLLTV